MKNLIDLSGRFNDQWPWPWVKQQHVGLTPYDDPPGMPGEVHALPGRNIHDVFIEHICKNAEKSYLLHGHFGELASHAAKIRSWNAVRWLLLSIDSEQDRAILRSRQHRLVYHPYWLDEEQLFLYEPSMYVHYFNACPANICVLPLNKFWNRDLDASQTLDILDQWYQVRIDRDRAKLLHDKWHKLNFDSPLRLDCVR